MKITLKYLQAQSACNEGVEFVQENGFIGMEAKDFILKLIEHKKLDWANWLSVRVLNKLDKVRYAVYAAEQVIDIYEKKYTNDDRPRKAIEAAKNYIENPSRENAADAADSAADAAAAAAASAADAADAASASDSAFAAACAADAAYYADSIASACAFAAATDAYARASIAASASASAAAFAADAAASAATSGYYADSTVARTDRNILEKIIKYSLTLI